MKAAIWATAMLLSMAPAAHSAELWQEVLKDGFEGENFAPEGHLYYRDNFEQRAGTAEFQSEVKRTGDKALRLDVKKYCPADREGCSERAEIWEETKYRVPYDIGVWYGFAVRFAAPIPSDDHRYLIAQWKREITEDADGDFSPFLGLRMNNGKMFATVETNYIAGEIVAKRADGTCASGQIPVIPRPDTNQMRALVATDPTWKPKDGEIFTACTTAISVTQHEAMLPNPQVEWTDFAIYTKPGPGGDGQIEIYANDKPVVSIKGHIGHGDPGLGKNQYFKFGPYRAADVTDWTLYYDDFRRSPNCADVLTAGNCPAL